MSRFALSVLVFCNMVNLPIYFPNQPDRKLHNIVKILFLDVRKQDNIENIFTYGETERVRSILISWLGICLTMVFSFLWSRNYLFFFRNHCRHLPFSFWWISICFFFSKMKIPPKVQHEEHRQIRSARLRSRGRKATPTHRKSHRIIQT